MTNTQKRNGLIIIGAIFACIITICLSFYLLSEAGSTIYYTKIDNHRVSENDAKGGVVSIDGNMAYCYTLCSYTENGSSKEIKLGAERELREGAFLRMTVMPVRGVLRWEEVQYSELPTPVQQQYISPDTEGK